MVMTENVRAEMEKHTPGSKVLEERSSEILAMELAGSIAMHYPLFIRESKGSRVWDVDGNEYIDMTMGYGPHLLGHAPDVIVAAIQEAAARGVQWGLQHPYQEELGRLLLEASPCGEQALFGNSGTEATMWAIRAARAYSGKTKIAIFDGSYHGSHDYVLLVADPESPRAAPVAVPRGAGIPQETVDQVLMLPYRHEAAYELIWEHKDELALVMLEPVQSSNPRLDCGDFVRGVANVCREAGVLFLMDEVVTGFRLSYGGGQEFFDVKPDLATYGKALGGGLPMGAVVGRADVMEVFRIDIERPKDEEAVFAGGTFGGNPLAMAAGVAALTHMKEHPEIYPYLQREGERLAVAVNDFLLEEEFPAQLQNAASMFYLQFQRGRIDSARDIERSPLIEKRARDYYTILLKNGVLVPGVHFSLISTAHRPEDIDTMIDAFTKSFLEMRDRGMI